MSNESRVMGSDWTTEEAQFAATNFFRDTGGRPLAQVAVTLGLQMGRGKATPQKGFGVSGGKRQAAVPPVQRWLWGLVLREVAKVDTFEPADLPPVSGTTPATPGELWAVRIMLTGNTEQATYGPPTIDWTAKVLNRTPDWVRGQARRIIRMTPRNGRDGMRTLEDVAGH